MSEEAATDTVLVHAAAEPSRPEVGLAVPGYYRPLVGCFDHPVVRVSGPSRVIDQAAARLPDGPARAEAIAARLRRLGASLAWGEPDPAPSVGALLDASFERGRSSVEIMRADASLVPELQVGSWCDGGWRVRALRRVVRRRLRRAPAVGPVVALAADLAFWSGVRDAATEREWRRLTGSYVVLAYHRLAGEAKRGQEWLDVAPSQFDRQLRLLDRLGYRALTVDELVTLHRDPTAVVPRRRYAVTCDDGYRDNVTPLLAHAQRWPQLFVPTRSVGGRSHWLGDEEVADAAELSSLARAGVGIGSHARTHPSLPTLSAADLADEIAGSWDDLRELVPAPLPALAYPFGHHDAAVRDETARAGFAVAYTAQWGRNGVGTDLFCLRRAGIGGPDGQLAFLWKILTGELVPPRVQRWQARRAGVEWVEAQRPERPSEGGTQP